MVLIIFGATGDLSRRMLFPSLYHLHKSGKLDSEFKVIAFGRRDYDDQGFSDFLLEEFKDFYGQAFENESWDRFTKTIEYFKGDLNQPEDFTRLADRLVELDKASNACLAKVFYLAISSDLYPQTFVGLKQTSLRSMCDHKEHVKIVVEKPFGKDRESFAVLNNQLTELFPEEQIYRIDHYLGKETVQNILYFRAANPLFLNDWSNKSVDKIEVNVQESVGLETRFGYYDQYGQTKDMVQSHLLQLLSLIMMNLPEELNIATITESKLEILRNLKIADYQGDIVRGQYDRGVVDGKSVKAYREEYPELADSNTETYIRTKAYVDLPKWEGVEIVLTSGKRMRNKNSSVTLHFKRQEKVAGLTSQNKLVFQLQPMEAISLDLQVKKPGEKKLEVVPMVFKYQDNFKGLLPDAYEQLLLNVFQENKSSFITTEELEASWIFVDNIISSWQDSGNELVLYPSGSDVV